MTPLHPDDQILKNPNVAPFMNGINGEIEELELGPLDLEYSKSNLESMVLPPGYDNQLSFVKYGSNKNKVYPLADIEEGE